MYFKHRRDAGQQLAKALKHYQGQDAVVLALPRGGVPIGFEVAKVLKIPLDVIVARKLGAPGNSEFGIGAIAPGIKLLDRQSMSLLGISETDMSSVIATETTEMQRRIKLYRGDREELKLKDKIAILVDDGLATGVTAKAAIASVKLGKPKKIILAVPVCATDTAAAIRREVDEFVCLHKIENFMAVGYWYKNFEQLSDEQVLEMLATTKSGH